MLEQLLEAVTATVEDHACARPVCRTSRTPGNAGLDTETATLDAAQCGSSFFPEDCRGDGDPSVLGQCLASVWPVLCQCYVSVRSVLGQC